MKPLSSLHEFKQVPEEVGAGDALVEALSDVWDGLSLDRRRQAIRQLVEVTIDSLAEVGYVGSTLAQIASRADVSPGLVAHYFRDKDGLLDAAP